MKVSTLFHKYKDNMEAFVLPDDNEFIRECAKKYIITQIKNRKSIDKYRKTNKGKTAYRKANKKQYQKIKSKL